MYPFMTVELYKLINEDLDILIGNNLSHFLQICFCKDHVCR